MLYNVVLVSPVQQSESATRVHMSPPLRDVLSIQAVNRVITHSHTRTSNSLSTFFLIGFLKLIYFLLKDNCFTEFCCLL